MSDVKFKPMLAPNDQPNLDDVKYPLLASYKLDGIRCLFIKGKLLTRALKPIKNKQLNEKLEYIRAWTEKTGNILDGEIYSPELTFQEINSFVMTEDFESKKSIKKHGEVLTIPDHLQFYCFDALFGGDTNFLFHERTKMACEVSNMFQAMVPVNHIQVESKEDVDSYFKEALENDYEGLILRSPLSPYKCGRGTIREGFIYKVKPFVTFDAVIKEVKQGTVVNPDVPTTTNELGRTVTSKKKGDRLLVDKVSDFVVDYEGHTLKVSCSSLKHDEREKYWKVRDSLIGKTIEYKGMLIGAKDVPRHPVFIRFREDK